MALRDPQRKHSEIREDLKALREEVRGVTTWSVFKDTISNVTQGRAMGAMGILNAAGEPDKRSKKLNLRTVKLSSSQLR